MSKNCAGPPKVTIGLATYNNENTVSAAIETLLNQTYRDFELLVSDDASKDRTVEIIEEFARRDTRVMLIRNEQNLGQFRNLRSLLERARSPYFMFAMGDDMWRPLYVEQNVAQLDKDPEVVASMSAVEWTQEGQPIGLNTGNYSLLDTPRKNIAALLRQPWDSSRPFALYRRKALLAAFPTHEFHAYDIASNVAILLSGKHLELPEVQFTRDRTDHSKYRTIVGRENKGLGTAALVFPFWPCTRHLLFEARIPISSSIVASLLRLNLEQHVSHAELKFPLYGAPMRRVARLVRRLLGADPKGLAHTST